MIEVRNLTKRYGRFQAVRDVSFSVGTGAVLGFLGPNGAGKTTVMKILTGYHFPSSGEALVDGFSVREDPVAVKRRIGYLPEGVPLYGELTVDEYLDYAAASRGIDRLMRKARIDEAVEACGLAAMRGKPIESLSKGYKQRTGLAQAILHDPPILILDEPTTGLDPNQIIEIRALIKKLGSSKTVILSTHILQEVEAVCSRVLILNEGRIAAQGSPEEIAGTMKGGETWDLTLKADADKLEVFLPRLAANIGALEQRRVERLPDGQVQMSFLAGSHSQGSQGAQNAEAVFDWAVASGFKILSMSRKRLSLEDIFVKLTHEEAPSGKSGSAKGGR